MTHGTGTSLGDPIEINALLDVIDRCETNPVAHSLSGCAITSTKTNFGHTLAASGLVSLMCLVEAMRHETIPASLHCDELSDYVDWDASWYYVNRANKPWPKQAAPRLGAVSAFGMSGTNAHMVLASFDEPPVLLGTLPQSYLLVLSAKTPDALKQQAENLLAFFNENDSEPQLLSRVSYILLTGRQHFTERFAFVVDDVAEARAVLSQFGSEPHGHNFVNGKVSKTFRARVGQTHFGSSLIQAARENDETQQSVRDSLMALGDLYCQGYALAWNELFIGQPQRIGLPTYPFARESFWVEGSIEVAGQGGTTKQLHPLLHENTSSGFDLRFTSRFDGNECFLADHQVLGQKILPGTGHLEMAREAIARTLELDGDEPLVLRDVVWLRPVVHSTDEPFELRISVNPLSETSAEFDIYSLDEDGEELIYSQGRVRSIGR